MSSEDEPMMENDPNEGSATYESALFGQGSTTNLDDFDSEFTHLDDTTHSPSANAGAFDSPPASGPSMSEPAASRPAIVRGLAPNHIFAEHRLTRHVASGRIADVWLAFDPELQCRRAIKIMRPEIAAEPRAVDQFFRAVRAQGQLKHSNIVQILRVGRHETIPYTISEWVEGGSISQWLAREGAMPVSIAWDVLRQVLVALSHAYSQGLMHKDCCPDNILVETLPQSQTPGEARKLHVRLTNFGLSSVLDSVVDGTVQTPATLSYGSRPEYVAPELITGLPVDFRADVYSAGILLYHLLVGFPPFRAATRGELLFKQVHDPMPAVPPIVREGLSPAGMAILKRMTEKLPTQRFPSYKELLEAVFAAPVLTDRRRSVRDQVSEYLPSSTEGRPTRAKRPGAPPAAQGSGKALKLAAGAVVTLALVVGFFAWKKQNTPQPPPPAVAQQLTPAPASALVVAPQEQPARASISAGTPAAAPQVTVTAAAVERPASPDAALAAMPSLPAASASGATSPVASGGFSNGELILDDATPGALKLQPTSGWMSTATPGSYKESSLLASVDGTLKTATFYADVPEEGEYDVSLWWVPANAPMRSSKTICTIFTTTGPFRGTLDQTGSPGSGGFFPVGHYTLPAGQQIPIAAISTEGLSGGPASMVSVDALKLVKTGASTARTTGRTGETATPPAASGTGERLIIEAGADGLNHKQYKEISGKWIDSRIPAEAAKSAASGLTAQGKGISRKSVFSDPGRDHVATVPAIARFYPKFESEGHYNVYVTWPRGGNARPVEYVVRHAGGEAKRTFAQDGYGLPGAAAMADSWISLGDYDFVPGDDNYVEIQLNPGAHASQSKASGQVYADAVCFSPTALPDAKKLNDNAVFDGRAKAEEQRPKTTTPAVQSAPVEPVNNKPEEIAGPLQGTAL